MRKSTHGHLFSLSLPRPLPHSFSFDNPFLHASVSFSFCIKNTRTKKRWMKKMRGEEDRKEHLRYRSRYRFRSL